MVSSETHRTSTTSGTRVSNQRTKKPSASQRGIGVWIKQEKTELSNLRKELKLHKDKLASLVKELKGYANGSTPIEQLILDEHRAINTIERDIGTCDVRIAELERKLK
jgi:chromosome segregation ATPase